MTIQIYYNLNAPACPEVMLLTLASSHWNPCNRSIGQSNSQEATSSCQRKGDRWAAQPHVGQMEGETGWPLLNCGSKSAVSVS